MTTKIMIKHSSREIVFFPCLFLLFWSYSADNQLLTLFYCLALSFLALFIYFC